MVSQGSNRRIIIELPPNLRIPPDEVEERLRIELALRLYERGVASFGQARRIAKLSKWSFLELLAHEKIPIKYGKNDLKEDLERIKNLSSEI